MATGTAWCAVLPPATALNRMRPRSQRLPGGWHSEAPVMRPCCLGLLPAAGRCVAAAKICSACDAGARSAGVLLWPAARVGAGPRRQRRRRWPAGAPGAQRRGVRRVSTCAACKVYTGREGTGRSPLVPAGAARFSGHNPSHTPPCPHARTALHAPAAVWTAGTRPSRVCPAPEALSVPCVLDRRQRAPETRDEISASPLPCSRGRAALPGRPRASASSSSRAWPTRTPGRARRRCRPRSAACCSTTTTSRCSRGRSTRSGRRQLFAARAASVLWRAWGAPAHAASFRHGW
jgi:hypothetical protein